METDSSERTETRPQDGDQHQWMRPPLIGHSRNDIHAGGEPNDLLFKDETTDDDQKAKFDTARGPSPPCSISSITSNRKLEWDSGADVGYLRQNTNLESLSTIERIALEGGRNAFRMEPEGVSSNPLQPIAKSTPRDISVSKKVLEEKYLKLFGHSKQFGRLSNSLNDLTEIESSELKRSFSNRELDKHKKSTSTSTMSTVISKNATKSDKIIQTSINIPMKLSIGLQASDMITLNIDPNGIKEAISLRKKDRPFCFKCCQKKVSTDISSCQDQSSTSNESVHVHTLENLKPVEVEASFEYLPGTEDINELKKKLKAESQKTITTISSDKKFQSHFHKKHSLKNKKYYNLNTTLEKDLEMGLEILKKVLNGRSCDKTKKEKIIKKIVKRIVETNYADDSSSDTELSRAATEVERSTSGRSRQSQHKSEHNSVIQACTDHSSGEGEIQMGQKRPQIEDKIPIITEQPAEPEISKILTENTAAFTDASSVRYYDEDSTSYPEVSSRSSISRQSYSLKFSPESSKDDKRDTIDSKKYNKHLHLTELQRQIDHLSQLKKYLEQEDNTQIIENFTKVLNLGSPSREASNIQTESSSSVPPTHHYPNQGSLSKTTQIPSSHRLYTPKEIATQTFFDDNNIYYPQTLTHRGTSSSCSSFKPKKNVSNQKSDESDLKSASRSDNSVKFEYHKSNKLNNRTSTSTPCTEYTDTNTDIQVDPKPKSIPKNKNISQNIKSSPKRNPPGKSTAYLLTFETEVSSDTSELEPKVEERPLTEVTVKIPSRKKEKNLENQAPLTQIKSTRLTLQEFLRKKRPDYLEHAESRQRCLEELQVLRELRQESRRKLLESTNSRTTSIAPIRERIKYNTDKMKQPTNSRRDFLFQEQEAKRVELKKKAEYKTNRLMAEIFTKKLQKKVLKGQVNLSTNTSVISTI